jgi:hypothetical protein
MAEEFTRRCYGATSASAYGPVRQGARQSGQLHSLVLARKLRHVEPLHGVIRSRRRAAAEILASTK